MIPSQQYIVVSKNGSGVVQNATKGTGRRSWNFIFGLRREDAQPMNYARAVSVLRSAGRAYKIEPVRA